MHLLVIGSDRNLFKNDSDIWNRYLDYGKLFEEIHIIVFSHKNLDNKDIKIGDNVFIYSTNHICKFSYLWNIYKISKQILDIRCPDIKSPSFGHRMSSSWVISTQDAFESGLAGWMLKKIYKIPLQIQIHTDFLSPHFWQESFINKLRVILAKFIIPRADGIRVVSERIKQSILGHPMSQKSHASSDIGCRKIKNLKIDVLPIFVDTDSIKNAPIKTNLHKKYPQFDFIVLMASRLTKEKNISLAIEAVSELVHPRAQVLGEGVKKSPKLGLIIVGSGPELNNLKLKTSNLKLDENIKLEGWSDDLASYYKTADLFLLTSNYEGYGRTVIEAMSAGLPVITTNVGLAGEVLINDKNGIIIPVCDKNALIGEIGLLIKNNSKRDFFSIESKNTLKNLITKERYLGLYKKIIESIA